jgi:hypothetical protein
MHKAGIAFFARLLFPAVLIEAGNGEPGPICGLLSCLRIKPSGKGILARKLGTVDLQRIVIGAPRIHPEPHAFIADKLHGANGRVNRGLLCLVGFSVCIPV